MLAKRVFVGAVLLALVSVTSTSRAQNLRIYHIDVEQGDATLFVSPLGNTLLVDSGKNGAGDEIKAVMTAAGVSRIDFFVCTHYHEDHYGGIDELFNDPQVAIGQSFDRGDKDNLSASKLAQDRYVDYDTTVGRSATQLTRGRTIPLDPAMSVLGISCGGVVFTEEPPVPSTHENDMSVSLLIQYGNFRYFIGGDIEVMTEGKIAERDLVMNVDVYQANHHGSHTSSSLGFMQDLVPTVIVISNGNHGGHKHPRQHTLNTYSSLSPNPEVFQTNKYLKGGVGGNVPDDHIGDRESDDDEGTIRVTVTATGAYTVSYRDQSHSFQSKSRSSSNVVIVSLLPNPVGSDRDLERVTLRNDGQAAVDLTGWRLEDESGRTWTLAQVGMLGPGQNIAIIRNRMPMSLNNGGDEITLFDGASGERDRFRYEGSVEGVEIVTNH